MKCACCYEPLRGKKAIAFDGKAVCASPCGVLTRIRRVFTWGVMETTGPELLRLFILEAARWSEKS